MFLNEIFLSNNIKYQLCLFKSKILATNLFNPDESGKTRRYKNIVQSVVTDCQKSFLNFDK